MDDLFQDFMQLVEQTKRLLLDLQTSGIASVPGIGLAQAETPKAPDKANILESLRKKASVCESCRLCKGRNKVVFGEGSPDASVVFVGEGPGREEDLQGRPFVGAAGTLLTKIIQAMKLQREVVYIANVVKCRPPNNRPPEPDEAAACRHFLETQLLTIRPKVICALGKTAASALLETEAPMNALRGRALEWKGIPLVVTYHPAYLLRNPPAKKLVWEDMQLVLELLT